MLQYIQYFKVLKCHVLLHFTWNYKSCHDVEVMKSWNGVHATVLPKQASKRIKIKKNLQSENFSFLKANLSFLSFFDVPVRCTYRRKHNYKTAQEALKYVISPKYVHDNIHNTAWIQCLIRGTRTYFGGTEVRVGSMKGVHEGVGKRRFLRTVFKVTVCQDWLSFS